MRETLLQVPGWDGPGLLIRRDGAGRLLHISAGGRTHFERRDGEVAFGDGLAWMRELATPGRLLRTVHSGEQSWQECYRWDEAGRPTSVDGVTIERDDLGRVVACKRPRGTWRYGYSAAGHLAFIEPPEGARRVLAWDEAGRPAGLSGPGPDPDPARHARDAMGRLWTSRDDSGTIVRTWLWDGLACFGRIDGPPDAPLDCVFSLDLSRTPVRLMSRHGVTVVPRDAFGEGLLAVPGAPGLFGGAIVGDLVHYRARALDPHCGTFTKADPFDGGEGDPRRAGGWRGPLPVEPDGRRQPYAVCRNDPIGRADPTGEISAGVTTGLLTLSSLTWSSGNMLTSFFLLDPLNFLLGLFSKEFWTEGRWFSKSAIRARYHGGFGLRYDPIGFELLNINKGRAWTFQHAVWAQSKEFTDLDPARVFIPSGPFRPQLYDSLLRIDAPKVDDDRPARVLVLHGAQRPGGMVFGVPSGAAPPEIAPVRFDRSWTRRGGAAEAVVPGALVPHFPAGGLHFAPQARMRTPRAEARIIEVVPTGDLAVGKVGFRQHLVVPARGLGLSAGQELFLTGTGGLRSLAAVDAVRERNEDTLVFLRADPPAALGTNRLRLRAIAPPTAAAPARPAVTLTSGSAPGRLDARLTAGGPIVVDTPLRLRQGGAVVGVAKVERLEAAVGVDAAPERANGAAPRRLWLAAPAAGGGDRHLTADAPATVSFPAGTAPARGAALQIFIAGGPAVARLVAGEPAANQRSLDRDLPAALASAPAGTLRWRPLTRVRPLGIWEGASGPAEFIYRPETSGIAVAAAPLLVVDADNAIRQVRDGTGLVRDELVLGTAALPGNPANPYDVEPLAFAGPERDARLEPVATFAFDSPPTAVMTTAPRPVLSLHRLATTPGSTPTLAAAAVTGVLRNLPALAAATIALNLPADNARLVAGAIESTRGPGPGQPVRLTAAGVSELALVKTIRIDAEADRDPGLGAAGLTLVPLIPASFLYVADLLPPDRLQLRPQAFRLAGLEPLALAAAPPGPVDVQLAQIAAGEVVRAVWNGVTGNALLRVEAVEGTTLKVSGSGIAALGAASPTDLKIMRMAPADPGTGTGQAGINGLVAAPGPAPRLRFDVWSPNALAARAQWYADLGDSGAAAAITATPALHRWWAVSDGSRSVPVQITRITALSIELHALPAAMSGRAGVALEALHVSDLALIGEYVLDGSQLTAEELDLPAGPELVVAVPHRAPAGGVGADGRLSSGTVMIPDDATESWYLDRPTSLETHELQHTLQSAMLGPLLFGFVPIALIEDIIVAGGLDVAAPEWSAYVPARLVEDDGLRYVEIPDPGGVTFEEGRNLEVTAGNQVVVTKLGEADGSRFRLGGAIGAIADGPVQIRQARGSSVAGTITKWILDIASLATLGNVASTAGAAIFGLLPTVIGGVINAANGRDFFDPFHFDFFPAKVPDIGRPAAVLIEPRGADRLTLRVHDRVRVRADGRSLDTLVTAVPADGIVELATAPPIAGDERRLDIAFRDREDPLHRISTGVADYFHMPWLRWIYDPWGQLRFETTPEPGGVTDWLLRLSRWSFSSSAWSFLFPGVFILDNALNQRKEKGHLSWMEQNASGASGDLYSPLARLRGPLDFVGDLARYRLWAGWREASMVPGLAGDAPGTIANRDEADVVLFPRRQGGAAVRAPNADQQAHPDAAADVPDALVIRNLLDPARLPVTGPNTVRPSALAVLPSEAGLQRTFGIHVAFTRPGSHRITAEGFPWAADAEEAQTAGKQTILFDRDVAPVQVSGAGRDIADGGTLTVIPCQRLALTVTPGGERRYQLMLQRPVDGTIVRLAGSDLAAQVQTALGDEIIEVHRVHGAHPFAIEEDKSVRWPQVHLLSELRIPVRRLRLLVVDRIDCLATLEPAGSGQLPPAKPFALPGEEAFLIVSARLHLARPGLAVTYPASRPLHATDPNPALAPVNPVPPALRELVGDGAVLRVLFDATDPPEEICRCEWTLSLRATQPRVGGGTENISANIHAAIELRPHFRLEPPAAGTAVAAGGTIVLHTSDGVIAGAVTVTPSEDVAVTISADGRNISLAVASTASTGPRRVVVEDVATPTRRARRTILVT